MKHKAISRSRHVPSSLDHLAFLAPLFHEVTHSTGTHEHAVVNFQTSRAKTAGSAALPT